MATVGRGRRWRGFAVASALGALAACSARPLPPATEWTPAPVATPAPADLPKESAEADSSSTASQTAALPRPGATPEMVRLVGLSRESLQELLGPASFIRRDGPVQIWRYTDEACFLDIFLFREGDAFRVNHVEARAKGTERVSVPSCYSRLRAARTSGRAG